MGFCFFWLQKLGELKLGELLDTPPPGLDEAIAISKACIFLCAMMICFIAKIFMQQTLFALMTIKTPLSGHSIS